MVDIKISVGDLDDPRIDEVLEVEQAFAQRDGTYVEDVRTPLYLNPIFYYSVSAALGAFVIWAIFEHYSEEVLDMPAIVSNFVAFGPIAGVISMSIGFTYGIANRNLKQSFYCGIVGLGVGLGVTLITSFIGGYVFGIAGAIAGVIGQDSIYEMSPGVYMYKGFAFFVFMCGRGLTWSIISMGAGLGLGIALKSKKLIVNGLAGGMVGGLLGGMLFDPISRFVSSVDSTGELSRAVGMCAVGCLTGLFIGLFENVSKESWFAMLKGPLTGKQFVFFKSPMTLGSAPKCDVYLFKDAAIEPQHATVTKSGNKYIIEDKNTESGTYINNRRIDRYILQAGDIVTMGETVLKYNEKQDR